MIPTAAKVSAQVVGGALLGVLVFAGRGALGFVAVPAGLLAWIALFPVAVSRRLGARPVAWASPSFCVKFALLTRDAVIGRTLARPWAGDGPNPWPWPWDETPADVRRYGWLELV